MSAPASQTAAAAGDIVSVSAATTPTHGRFLVSAGRNHFVSDARASAGGPGEAVQAGELLLASLASCALALIQKQASPLGVKLKSAGIQVSFKRDPADSTRYEYIRLHVQLEGVDKPIGEALVAQFTSTCPIYNTLRRGGNVEISLETVPAGRSFANEPVSALAA